MSSVPFTFRIDPEMKSDLEAAAMSTDRTPGYLVKKAVAAYLEARAFKKNELEKAVARADQGTHFISRNAMHQWLEAKAKGENPEQPNPDVSL